MNLEFCLIENQYSKDREVIACITTEGETELDRSALDTSTYQNAAAILNNHGFVALEKLWFERYGVENFEKDTLIQELEELGLAQSTELCTHLQDMIDLTYAVDKTSPISDNGDPEFFYPESTTTVTDTVLFNDIVSDYPKRSAPQRNSLIAYKIPKHAERINLCFYLFLDAILHQDNSFYFAFRGDVYDDTGDESSNYIKPVKMEFERLDWTVFQEKGQLVFQSVKTYKEIMEEMDFLYSVKYKFMTEQAMVAGKKMKATMNIDHNILEIKDCIQPENKIVFEMSFVEFQNMCVISDHIEKEIEMENSEMISTSILRNTYDEVFERFDKKRDEAAHIEDYEEASHYRNLLEDLENRRVIIENLDDEEISIEEYNNKFIVGKF